MNDSDNNKQHPSYREMTVANIREHSATDRIDIVFLESARFYKLYRENPNFEQALRLLHEAMAKGAVLDVGLESPNSDIIEKIKTP